MGDADRGSARCRASARSRRGTGFFGKGDRGARRWSRCRAGGAGGAAADARAAENADQGAGGDPAFAGGVGVFPRHRPGLADADGRGAQGVDRPAIGVTRDPPYPPRLHLRPVPGRGDAVRLSARPGRLGAGGRRLPAAGCEFADSKVGRWCGFVSVPWSAGLARRLSPIPPWPSTGQPPRSNPPVL